MRFHFADSVYEIFELYVRWQDHLKFEAATKRLEGVMVCCK